MSADSLDSPWVRRFIAEQAKNFPALTEAQLRDAAMAAERHALTVATEPSYMHVEFMGSIICTRKSREGERARKILRDEMKRGIEAGVRGKWKEENMRQLIVIGVGLAGALIVTASIGVAVFTASKLPAIWTAIQAAPH